MTEKELLEREELLEDILDALEDGDYEETEDLADEAIEAFPKEAFGYYYMAEALFFQGELEEAVHYYGLAIERAADNPDYKARLALMHAKLGEEDKAKQIYKTIVEQHDQHAASLVALGVYASNEDDYKTALDYLDRAIEAAADYDDAYRVRSIIHSNLGDYEAALQDLEQALEKTPEDNQLWLSKIKLLDNAGREQATFKAFEDWIALAPEESNRHHAQATYYAQQEHFKEAEAAYNKAIEHQIYGEYAALASILGRAWARLAQHNLDDAIEDFGRVVDLEPKTADAYIGLAESYYEQGELDAALNYLDIGLDAVIDEPWVLYNKKGVLLTKSQQWEAAQVAFEAILEYDDEEARAEGYFSLGKLYQAKSDLQTAFRNWRKASDIFHLEADQCIELYCSEFLEQELREKEVALLGDMQENFQENSRSAILKDLFGQYWTVDWRATVSNNKMLKDMPADFEKPFKAMMTQLCLTITAEGLLLVNPSSDGVRLVYAIEKEDRKQATIEGVPLNGTLKRSFTLIPKGKQLILQGFGDEEADIDLYLEATAAGDLSSAVKQSFRKLEVAGDLSYLGAAFKKP
jgi:tetratricopeptide (TPR) repeat protein